MAGKKNDVAIDFVSTLTYVGPQPRGVLMGLTGAWTIAQCSGYPYELTWFQIIGARFHGAPVDQFLTVSNPGKPINSDEFDVQPGGSSTCPIQ